MAAGFEIFKRKCFAYLKFEPTKGAMTFKAEGIANRTTKAEGIDQ